ncbi:MAG: type II secretion system protein M [Deltaproteobacteria bacterium]|nr:type II secretion system protein M [Deltaproteobacteria bacterium]
MIDHLNLNKREKIFVIAGALFVLLTLIYAAAVAPYTNLMERLDSKVALRGKQVTEAIALKNEILLLQQQLREAEQKISSTANFSLFSFVEQKVQGVAGKENLVHMRPKPATEREDFEESSLEIKLEKITLQQVVRLLYEMEAADVPLNVKALQLRNRTESAALLDVTMDISTLRKKT